MRKLVVMGAGLSVLLAQPASNGGSERERRECVGQWRVTKV